jgi:hypothetical protein
VTSFKFPQDYLDFFSALETHEVEYAVAGAFAMAAWGYIRATGDIDVWVLPTPDNAKRLFSALKEFGAPLQGITAEDFAEPGVVFQMGQPPLRIDILTSLDGIKIPKSLVSLCVRSDAFGAKLPVLLLDVLIENKKATAREKDLADVQALIKLREKK